MYQNLPYNITRIDTGLMGPGVVACYLIESEGETAIVETGNFKTTERILSLLEDRQLAKEKVRYIIPTHVHLDHAGGASSLIEALPNAQLVIHPFGAKHMIDPTKLIAGASAVYGEKKFNDIYGQIKPIAENRVIIAEDGDILNFGNRPLLFRDTPGHASHHFCVWDELSSGWFTGDTFGIGYPKLSNGNEPFLFPTTTPVQFNPDALVKSIKLMMSYQPETMYLTHFGAIKVKQSMADDLCLQINDYVEIVKSQIDTGVTVESIFPLLEDYIYQQVTNHGTKISKEEFKAVATMDITLNTQGLVVWSSRN